MVSYMRGTPSAFWIALVGIGFFLCVFVSGIWEEMSLFAVLYLIPGYLAVAVLTAVHRRNAWTAAFVLAALIAVFEVGAALLFLVWAPVQERQPNIAAIHATGAVIAAAAATSALLAALHGAPRTERPAPRTISSPT